MSMKFLRILVLVLLGLSVGYSARLVTQELAETRYDPRERVTVVFDPRLPTELRKEFMVGAAYWNCVGARVSEQPGGRRLLVSEAHLPLGTIGRYERYTGGAILLDAKQLGWEPRIVRIAAGAHEVGHAFGLEHMPGYESIMYEYTSYTQHLSVLDVAQFNHVWRAEHDSSCPDVPGTVGP